MGLIVLVIQLFDAEVFGNKDSTKNKAGPPSDDSGCDEDAGQSNHLCVLSALQTIDFVSGYVDLCPSLFGIPETRGRIYYVGLKVAYWMHVLSLPREQCQKFLMDKLSAIIATVKRLAAASMEPLPLCDFLVPESHALFQKMQRQAHDKSCRVAKARMESSWLVMHTRMFQEAELKFEMDPRDHARYGFENAWYNIMPARERSILFYFDETSPATVHDEVINTRCPKMMVFTCFQLLLCVVVAIAASRVSWVREAVP